MNTIVSNPSLNATQLFVLQTFATAENEYEREELTSLYLDYIQKKKVLKSLKAGFKDVREIIDGKQKRTTIDEFINELRNNND